MMASRVITIAFNVVGCLLGLAGIICLVAGRRIDGHGFLLSAAFCWLIYLLRLVTTIAQTQYQIVDTVDDLITINEMLIKGRVTPPRTDSAPETATGGFSTQESSNTPPPPATTTSKTALYGSFSSVEERSGQPLPVANDRSPLERAVAGDPPFDRRALTAKDLASLRKIQTRELHPHYPGTTRTSRILFRLEVLSARLRWRLRSLLAPVDRPLSGQEAFPGSGDSASGAPQSREVNGTAHDSKARASRQFVERDRT